MFTKQSNKYLIQKNNNNNQIGQYPFALPLSLSLWNSKALILNQIHSEGWWVCFVYVFERNRVGKKIFFRRCHSSLATDPLPDAHSSLATDPLIGATHHWLHLHRRQNHPLIHLPEFFFFFSLSSIIFNPTVSWPPPPSLIHSFNPSSGFFPLYCCMALSIWIFGWFMGHGWLGLWVMKDGWDVLWVLVVAELWVLGG